MKKEGLNALKEGTETVSKKFHELTENELKRVVAGTDFPTKPRPKWAWTNDYRWCPNCNDWVRVTAGPTIDGQEFRVCTVCDELILCPHD